MAPEIIATATMRWWRALVVAWVAACVTCVAHVLGGGRGAHPVTMLLMVAFTTAIAARFLGSRASTARVVMLLAAGQALSHLALEVQMAWDGAAATGTSLAMAGGSHGALHGVAAGTMSPPIEADGGQWAGLDARMLVAHVVATVVLGAWLAAGERRLWRLISLLAAGTSRATLALVRLVRALISRMRAWCGRPAGRAATPSVGWPDRLLVSRLLLSLAVSRRGPPALV